MFFNDGKEYYAMGILNPNRLPAEQNIKRAQVGFVSVEAHEVRHRPLLGQVGRHRTPPCVVSLHC